MNDRLRTSGDKGKTDVNERDGIRFLGKKSFPEGGRKSNGLYLGNRRCEHWEIF